MGVSKRKWMGGGGRSYFVPAVIDFVPKSKEAEPPPSKEEPAPDDAAQGPDEAFKTRGLWEAE